VTLCGVTCNFNRRVVSEGVGRGEEEEVGERTCRHRCLQNRLLSLSIQKSVDTSKSSIGESINSDIKMATIAYSKAFTIISTLSI
jgi:hypothetical protein